MMFILLNFIKKAHELQQQLDEFYAHAQEITKNQFSYFNKLSLFHDIRQWLKEETNNLDKWNRNNEQIKLLESRGYHNFIIDSMKIVMSFHNYSILLMLTMKSLIINIMFNIKITINRWHVLMIYQNI